MVLIYDQIGRSIEINKPIQRIVSVVPSLTELLYDLGLGDKIVGQTKFCIHPKAEFKSASKIGGTKSIQIEKLKSLNPDFVLANKEENTQEQIEEIATFCPVYVSDIKTIEDTLNLILDLGKILQAEEKANLIHTKIKHDFDSIPNGEPMRCIYAIWYNPWMFAGKDTFISHILSKVNLQNAVAENRYPSLTLEEIEEINPDVILLSSEPFPFKEKHIVELKDRFKNTKIKLVDGELFSWYGSRLLYTKEYLLQLRADFNEH